MFNLKFYIANIQQIIITTKYFDKYRNKKQQDET